MAKTKAKPKSKPAAARRGAKKTVARAAKSKPKHVKRATPIKQSSKPAKKAAPRKPAKKSPVSRAKPAAHKPAKPVKAAAARKPVPKKAVVKKPVQSAAKRPAPAKSAPARSAPVKSAPVKAAVAARPPRHHDETERGGIAVATPGTEPTITKEDGRYALPATVNIELPRGYKPSPKEEYMGPRQLAYFRNKLREWREQLVEESRQTMENLREEVRDVGDDAERATRETENSLELRTRDRYRKLISKIDKALRRIEEGRYGYCEETDEEIGIERLEARPIATLSLDAQERREHLQKQMGD
ncbi:MAG TPA: RNA polymerase-binding protein DksA [Rhodanobacteraceae bacterium]